MRIALGGLVFLFVLVGLGPREMVSSSAALAQGKSFGCYRIVNASSVRIRKRPYLSSKTLDYAKRGDKVVKNRRFCSIRWRWCRIRKGKTSGWVGRKFLKKISC